MNVEVLKSDLRAIKALGRSSDSFTFSIMWQSKDTLLLRYISSTVIYSCWIMVRRTSVQYFKVLSCVTKFDYSYTVDKCFRNSRLTAEYIKEFIK